jgi:hypothetical protein
LWDLRVESLYSLVDLELRVLFVNLSKHLDILPHPHSDALRISPIELLVVLPETDLLHRDDDVRAQHEVLHALHILPVHLLRHISRGIHIVEVLDRLLKLVMA